LPVRYKLDKIFDVGVLYEAESDKAYLIERAGTDSTAKATLRVAEAPVGSIVADFAPLFETDANLLGPADLKLLRVVVPPGKKFSFTGAAGSKLRATGQILELAPGEVLPTDLAARAVEQTMRHVDYLIATLTKPAGTVIASGLEETVLTFTCPPGEKWLFKNLLMAEAIVDTVSLPAHQFAFRIYVHEKPLDLIETKMGRKGIANRSAPYPPRDPVNREPFTLQDMPIELTAGRVLKIAYVNTDAAYTVPTGQTLAFKVLVVGEKALV